MCNKWLTKFVHKPYRPLLSINIEPINKKRGRGYTKHWQGQERKGTCKSLPRSGAVQRTRPTCDLHQGSLGSRLYRNKWQNACGIGRTWSLNTNGKSWVWDALPPLHSNSHYACINALHDKLRIVETWARQANTKKRTSDGCDDGELGTCPLSERSSYCTSQTHRAQTSS